MVTGGWFARRLEDGDPASLPCPIREVNVVKTAAFASAVVSAAMIAAVDSSEAAKTKAISVGWSALFAVALAVLLRTRERTPKKPAREGPPRVERDTLAGSGSEDAIPHWFWPEGGAPRRRAQTMS